MEFAALLQAMNQASGFELYRLRAAIDRVLADPKWIIAIRSQLRIGQEIEYFDARANNLRPAQVLEFRTKEVLVREIDPGEHVAERGLARTVRADEADDLGAVQFERHTSERLHACKRARDASGPERCSGP